MTFKPVTKRCSSPNVRAATRWNWLPGPGPLPPTRAEQVGPVGTVVEVLATAAVVVFAPEVVAAVVGNPWAVVTAIADSSAGGSMLAGSAGVAVGSAALRYEASIAAKAGARVAPDLLRVGDLKLPAVPKGTVGIPTQTGKGMEYVIPRGTPEISERVASVRIMDPVSRESGARVQGG